MEGCDGTACTECLMIAFDKGRKEGIELMARAGREAISNTYDDGSKCEGEPLRCFGMQFCPWHSAMNAARLAALAAFDQVVKDLTVKD